MLVNSLARSIDGWALARWGSPDAYVVPDKIERILNRKTTSGKDLVDFEKQAYIALDGFTKNQFFIIINDKQVESLADEINLAAIQEIEFIKLTPLVGG